MAAMYAERLTCRVLELLVLRADMESTLESR